MSRGIALPFHDPRRLDGGGWSAPRTGRFTPGKDPVPIVQEAGWAAGSVWTGAENLSPTGIRSPDRPARYRLSYPGPWHVSTHIIMLLTSRSMKILLTVPQLFCAYRQAYGTLSICTAHVYEGVTVGKFVAVHN